MFITPCFLNIYEGPCRFNILCMCTTNRVDEVNRVVYVTVGQSK